MRDNCFDTWSLYFFVKHVFRCGGEEHTEHVKHMFIEKFADTDVPRRNTVRRLNSKFRETGWVS